MKRISTLVLAVAMLGLSSVAAATTPVAAGDTYQADTATQADPQLATPFCAVATSQSTRSLVRGTGLALGVNRGATCPREQGVGHAQSSPPSGHALQARRRNWRCSSLAYT